MSSVKKVIAAQFGHPSGVLGRLAGIIMQVRPSNRARNLRTLDLLDIQPADTVLEIGFGPGLAIERAAQLATAGKVVGIDHSELMWRQARRRNAKAIEERRVELVLGAIERLSDIHERFDKVFAVNVYMFWDDPAAVLRRVRDVMTPGGLIALTLQPRHRGATEQEASEVGARMAGSLQSAGFEIVRSEMLRMAPVSAACVLGRSPHRILDRDRNAGHEP